MNPLAEIPPAPLYKGGKYYLRTSSKSVPPYALYPQGFRPFVSRYRQGGWLPAGSDGGRGALSSYRPPDSLTRGAAVSRLERLMNAAENAKAVTNAR